MNTRFALAAMAGVGLAFSLACGGGSTVDTSFLLTANTGGTTSCPGDAASTESYADGDRLILLAIHSDDAYAGSEFEGSMPMAGHVDGDLHNNGDCWFGGGFVADNGEEFYFYKAAFKTE